MDKPIDQPNAARVFRRDGLGLAVCLGVGAIPLAIGMVAAVLHPESEWQPLVLIVLAADAFVWTWFSAFRIELHDRLLVYRTLFGGTRRVPLEEIAAACSESGLYEYADRFRAPFRLVIQPKPGAPWKRFDINEPVFTREGLSALRAFLGDRVRRPSRKRAWIA